MNSSQTTPFQTTPLDTSLPGSTFQVSASALEEMSLLQSIPNFTERSSDLNSVLSSAPTEFTPLQSLKNSVGQAFSTLAQTVASTFRYIYQGIATTTIGQIDPFTGAISNVRSSQTSVQAVITDPQSAGGIGETNPFNLSISSSQQEVTSLVEGAFSIFSAIPYDFRGGFLVQYWNLQYQNGQLTGQLTNPGNQLSLAVNLININEAIPPGYVTIPSQLLMSGDTTLSGQVTTDQMQVRIQGTATSLISSPYAFAIDVALSRVG